MTCDTPGTAQFVRDTPTVVEARVSIHHVQLCDLLQPSDTPGRVLYVSGKSVMEADMDTCKAERPYCRLGWKPNCLSSSYGLLAAGGLYGELAVVPLHRSRWNGSPGATHLRVLTGGSINNAVGVAPATPKKGAPARAYATRAGPADDSLPVHVLASNNDCTVKTYAMAERRPEGSAPDAAVSDGTPCLSRAGSIRFPTAINHCSQSPDGCTLVAVGDTSEVFVYRAMSSGEYMHVATYHGPSDASFSSSFSRDGLQFSIASQDGTVSVWDVRSSAKLAHLCTHQRRSARLQDASGAARVVKYSPQSDLLAFSEHCNYVHLIDTLSFTERQTLTLPPAPHPSSERTRRAGARVEARCPEGPSMVRERSVEGFARSSDFTDDLLHLLGSARYLSEPEEEDMALDSLGLLSALERAPPVHSYADTMSGMASRSPWARGRGPRPGETNVSGLCWDPDGRWLYCSTEDVIARYQLQSRPYAVGEAGLL